MARKQLYAYENDEESVQKNLLELNIDTIEDLEAEMEAEFKYLLTKKIPFENGENTSNLSVD